MIDKTFLLSEFNSMRQESFSFDLCICLLLIFQVGPLFILQSFSRLIFITFRFFATFETSRVRRIELLQSNKYSGWLMNTRLSLIFFVSLLDKRRNPHVYLLKKRKLFPMLWKISLLFFEFSFTSLIYFFYILFLYFFLLFIIRIFYILRVRTSKLFV